MTAYHVLADVISDPVGSEVWIEPVVPGSERRIRASVLATDMKNDLALLHSAQNLAGSVSLLALSDAQMPGTEFSVAGYGIMPESDGDQQFNFLESRGIWEGLAERPDGLLLAAATASGVTQGMSGCPIVRDGDQAVIGVLTGRYNSIDGWNQNRVWIARVEMLESLLKPYANPPIDRSQGSNRAVRDSWLTETVLNRQSMQNDVFYAAPEWSTEWDRAGEALRSACILIVVAAAGMGATTFVENLLLQITPESTNITRLDPGDWSSPNVESIPRRARRGAVLDLKDPEHDRPSEQFIRSLGQIATEFHDIQSHLVITVQEEVWPGFSAKAVDKVRVIYLRSAPDPVELAKRYIEARAPEVTSMFEDNRVVSHLRGRNAVQTMTAVERVLHLYHEAGRFGDTGPHLDASDIAEALDDHSEELDVMFADRDYASASSSYTVHRSGNLKVLSPQDRCLILALACYRHVSLRKLEEGAEQLEYQLRGKKRPEEGKSEPFLTLAKPGLRGRLQAIQAEPTSGDLVALKREGLAEAVVKYVWDNYPKSRGPLTAWVIGSSEELKGQSADELLFSAIQRQQDVDIIKGTIGPQAQRHNKPEILSGVLSRALRNPHMQRRCERLIYDWAVQSDYQSVVVEVAKGMLHTDRCDIAVKRLQRVADYSTSPNVLEEVSATFRETVDDPQLSEWFLEKAETWFAKSPDSRATGLAFVAIAESDFRGYRWLLEKRDSEQNVDRMIGRIIAQPNLSRAVIHLIQKASMDSMLYLQVLERIGHAVRQNGALLSMFNLSAQLRQAGSEANRDPVADLAKILELDR
ncbi:trypsin-like peptidase domain-containing protein [Actinoplanes ianthinogenes]|uniref:S1 family peptidase n=1 Tax=Actinoplanes ianthinogenes TaxID=122358 RepID=UPI0016701D13